MAEREKWQETFEKIEQMRQWMMQAEHIFDGSWATTPEEVTEAAVGLRLDQWLAQLRNYVGTLQPEQLLYRGLSPLLARMEHLRPHLACCYDLLGLPRTNNDLERCIRAIKTRYRRICGRKNWNSYVLRYGSCVAYYEWWTREPQGVQELESRLQRMTRGSWRQVREKARSQHHEQLDRFRFHHHRQRFLATLEAQWQAACQTG